MTFELKQADSPLVISVPHDGALIPDDIKAYIKPEFWHTPDRDIGIADVFDFDAFPYSKIVATHSRYVVDLNRPASGESLYPGKEETAVCPVRSFKDEDLYWQGQAPDAKEIKRRIKLYWQPYHDQLQALIDQAIENHGWCLLIDAHSIDAELPMLFDGRLPDINVGTFNGQSCSTDIQQTFTDALVSQSHYSHVINGRFKGGYITRHYGQPNKNCHAVQLEHVKDCYIEPKKEAMTAFWSNLLLKLLEQKH